MDILENGYFKRIGEFTYDFDPEDTYIVKYERRPDNPESCETIVYPVSTGEIIGAPRKLYKPCWVVFDEPQITHNNQNKATNVRLIQITWEDLDLAMQDEALGLVYQDRRCLATKKELIARLFIYDDQKGGRQLFFDYAIEVLSQRKSTIWEGCFSSFFYDNSAFDDYGERRFTHNLLIEPENYNIVVHESSKHEMALLSIAIDFMDKMIGDNVHIASYNSSVFNRCVSKCGKDARRIMGQELCQRLLDNYEKASKFLNNVPDDIILDLLSIKGLHLSLEIRIMMFEKSNNASYIYDETLVELWNNDTSSLYSYTYGNKSGYYSHIKWSIFCQHKAEIVSYVLSTHKASDLLLVNLFLWSEDTRCLRSISDEALICTKVPASPMADRFFSLFPIVPDSLRTKMFCSIRNRQVYPDEKKLTSIVQYAPEEMLVKLVVRRTVLKQWESKSSWSSKGYWTWGEGWKGERTHVTITLNTEYSCIVWAPQKKKPILESLSVWAERRIKEIVINGLKSNDKEAAIIAEDSRNGDRVFLWFIFDVEGLLDIENHHELLLIEKQLKEEELHTYEI